MAILNPLPEGCVILTFDDGVKSHLTFVAPLLTAHKFNATFYISEGLNFLKDKTRYLTWEEIRVLHDQGFEIGNHTQHHHNVTKQTESDMMADIHHIDQQCLTHGISKPITFCYPGYAHSPEAVALLQKHGFQFARRGMAPEYIYHREGGRGPAYDPAQHHPLLIPTTGAAGPAWNFDDFKWALDLATNGKAAVFTFHGVPDLDHPWVHTEPDLFDHCIQYLSDNKHTVMAMRDLSNHIDPVAT